jgi:small subunit ribosomal protein S15
MYLTPDKKKDIFNEHGKSSGDTGSVEGQIAVFTERINHLTNHLKEKNKDLSTRRSLVLLVGKRRRLLEYLRENDIERYRSIVKKLGIRK